MVHESTTQGLAAQGRPARGRRPRRREGAAMNACALVLLCALAAAARADRARRRSPVSGKAVYDSACAACHNSGAAGAPKLGDAVAWQSRFANGIGALYRSAVSGKGVHAAEGRASATHRRGGRGGGQLHGARRGRQREGAGGCGTRRGARRLRLRRRKPAGDGRGGGRRALGGATTTAAQQDAGAGVYARACAACHASGVAGAPKLGDAAAWAPKLKAGLATLQKNAIGGKGAMPPKGGNASLADADVRAAVAYMVDRASGARSGEAATATPSRAAPAGAPAVAGAASPVRGRRRRLPRPRAPVAAAVAPPRAADASPNAFNRLLRSASRRNPPPHEDGIHDPSIEEVYLLQPPLTGLAGLPSSTVGNRIDWVKALNQGKITPRFDRLDPQVQAAVMDLNIVREVKGSMPDVVYPHKQHTQWLDCSNCHPAIFKPQKGANPMSMAAIMLGEQCGVCHGKVAFPVSECRLCHSKNKVAGAAPAAPR